MASPKDLILKKLDDYREGQSGKRLNDIRDILVNVQVDEAYIKHWTEHLKLKSEWAKV